MRIGFTQIYTSPRLFFNISSEVLKGFSKSVNSILETQTPKKWKYEDDFYLIYYISAKKDIAHEEILGPAISKKTKTIEFSVFLPYEVIASNANPLTKLLELLSLAIVSILLRYGVVVTGIEKTLRDLTSDFSRNRDFQDMLFRDDEDD